MLRDNYMLAICLGQIQNMINQTYQLKLFANMSPNNLYWTASEQ